MHWKVNKRKVLYTLDGTLSYFKYLLRNVESGVSSARKTIIWFLDSLITFNHTMALFKPRDFFLITFTRMEWLFGSQGVKANRSDIKNVFFKTLLSLFHIEKWLNFDYSEKTTPFTDIYEMFSSLSKIKAMKIRFKWLRSNEITKIKRIERTRKVVFYKKVIWCI